ncbi:hypothetical protein HG470_000905 [Candidatus Saccharibacteria bacterium]|nr:hypothetical protein [Candidatus Saccharibacteria bacterium]
MVSWGVVSLGVVSLGVVSLGVVSCGVVSLGVVSRSGVGFFFFLGFGFVLGTLVSGVVSGVLVSGVVSGSGVGCFSGIIGRLSCTLNAILSIFVPDLEVRYATMASLFSGSSKTSALTKLGLMSFAGLSPQCLTA